MKKDATRASVIMIALLFTGCGATETTSSIDNYDIVRQYASDYDYYPSDFIYENPGDFGMIREDDISDYLTENAIYYDYISTEDAQDYVLQNVAYDLIREQEFSTLTTLRKMYGDVSVLGNYVLDVRNNTIHITSNSCSSDIESDNIEEYSMYVGKGHEENSPELCAKCIPDYVKPQYYGNPDEYEKIGITADNKLLTNENG